MNHLPKPLHPLLATVVIALLLHACNWPVDTGGDQERPPQTKILNVLVQPDTVAPGDTARFTCIIKDSTDKRFKFYWAIDAGKTLDGVASDPDYPSIYKTDKNVMRWQAPQKVGFYSFTVNVNNGTKDSVNVETSFSIIVE